MGRVFFIFKAKNQSIEYEQIQTINLTFCFFKYTPAPGGNMSLYCKSQCHKHGHFEQKHPTGNNPKTQQLRLVFIDTAFSASKHLVVKNE